MATNTGLRRSTPRLVRLHRNWPLNAALRRRVKRACVPFTLFCNCVAGSLLSDGEAFSRGVGGATAASTDVDAAMRREQETHRTTGVGTQGRELERHSPSSDATNLGGNPRPSSYQPYCKCLSGCWAIGTVYWENELYCSNCIGYVGGCSGCGAYSDYCCWPGYGPYDSAKLPEALNGQDSKSRDKNFSAVAF